MSNGFEYPALYNSAQQLSKSSQTTYLTLIKWEYTLLMLSAVLSFEFYSTAEYFLLYALTFLALLLLFLVRSWLKPEQDWYKGRALAESIKTSCWRYCMRAEPFGDADAITVRRAEFREHLRNILDANRHIGAKLPPDRAANDQITATMESTRGLSLEDRKAYYDMNRIKEQRKWYAREAGEKKRASTLWLWAGTLVYLTALFVVFYRVANPEFELLPVAPLIVAVTSIIGWTQVKKYNELASTYTLTAHEIGIIQSKVLDVNEEDEFSQFVNEAEQAFSREHTQWVARQQ